jgi:glycerate 2-kinase
MLEMVQRPDADDTVLCLISGGGSSLLPLPAGGHLAGRQAAVSRALLPPAPASAK